MERRSSMDVELDVVPRLEGQPHMAEVERLCTALKLSCIFEKGSPFRAEGVSQRDGLLDDRPSRPVLRRPEARAHRRQRRRRGELPRPAELDLGIHAAARRAALDAGAIRSDRFHAERGSEGPLSGGRDRTRGAPHGLVGPRGARSSTVSQRHAIVKLIQCSVGSPVTVKLSL